MKKFKPEIKKIKLNPEQAVLACDCWASGTTLGFGGTTNYDLTVLGVPGDSGLVCCGWHKANTCDLTPREGNITYTTSGVTVS